MRLYSVIARLLDYPDEILHDHLGPLQEWLHDEPDIAAEDRAAVSELVAWMDSQPLLALQEHYVQTFDMTPEHSLHLTHHLFGDDRGRGPALVDLSEHYKSAGLEAMAGELPDYLPLVLEYCSTLEPFSARVFLGDAAKVIRVLAANLERAGSPYAPVLRVIEKHGHLARTAA